MTRAKKTKMECPACGADMNMHAEKIDYGSAMRDPQRIDTALGGVVEEFHTCPKCGMGASRKAELK